VRSAHVVDGISVPKKEREREGTKKEKERQRREQVLRKKRVPWETRSMNED